MENNVLGDRVRREILSYRFEVERLWADYIRLLKAYDEMRIKVQGEGCAEEIDGALRSSKIWRYARPIFNFMSRLHGEMCLDDRLKSIGKNFYFPAIVSRSDAYPKLSSIPEISYEDNGGFPQKSWDTANFLGEVYYYNHMREILSRPESRGRPVFIQSVTIDWFVPLYQRPQHMALAMAERGYVVFYMTGNGQFDKAFGFHEVAPNVFITNQPVPLMLTDALISFYSTSPVMEYWLDAHGTDIKKNRHVVTYEYIDHISPEISFEYTQALIRQFERLNSKEVDLVVASADALMKEIGAKVKGVPTAYVPNGVDFTHYRRILDSDRGATVPIELRAVLASGKPIVGYFGALAPWIWYEVLNDLTEKRNDLEFVFIGPDYLGASNLLKSRENVHILGSIDYSLLPYYAQHFNVGIIPFRQGDIAKTTSPLKLFEYFALELPVIVSKGMDECTVYPEVFTFGSVDEFSDALDLAIKSSFNREFSQRYRELAKMNTWGERARILDESAKPLLAGRISEAL